MIILVTQMDHYYNKKNGENWLQSHGPQQF